MTDLNPKTRELVSLGVSASINCTPCLTYHIKRARALNISDEEIVAVFKLAKDLKDLVSMKVFEHTEQQLNIKFMDEFKQDPAQINEKRFACC